MIKRTLSVTALLILLISLVVIVRTPTSSAATAANWQAGRIIDDSLFADKDAMSVDQIQTFLNSKVGTGGYGRVAGQCDTNGIATSELGGGTRAQYGAAHNNPAPFTCLKDYYEVPKTVPGPGIPASNYGGVPIPAGARSAAQLIWDAAQKYNISPKVLLVTIQKESVGPLTTDDWPFRSQYTYAMGAHCPDSGPNHSANCDPNYSGFSIQISESAALFRYYLDNMNQSWWTYKKPGNNAILYNPSPDCGSSNVLIQTRATAALYTYTPYQPNQAALNNLYGTGDACSAYGNRNFWRIYVDWFGSTLKRQVSNNDPTSSWPFKTSGSLIRTSDGSAWSTYYDGLTGGWQGWVKVSGATLGSEPSVMNQDNDRLDAFAAGPAGDLIHTWSEFGLWQAWESVGWPSGSISIVGTPAAVSWASGRIDVFARGSDGYLWQKWYDASLGGWQPWTKHQVTISSAPSVSSWAKGRLDVFFTGVSGDLQHYYYNGVWKNDSSLGQPSQSVTQSVSPAAVSWASGRIDVFARGSDGYLWQKWYDASLGGWQPWTKHQVTISSAPSVSSWAKGRLDVFSKNTSTDILQHYWYDTSWATSIESLGKP